MSKLKIVIIGGGFAGVKCAKRLRAKLPSAKYDIVLFNRENHMVFHPLLAELAAGVIQPRHVAASLRHLLRGVHCRTEEVCAIELANNAINCIGDDGQNYKVYYDQLLIAHGNTVNLATIPGMADHAFPLKTAGDAIAIQQHVMEQMEKAELCEDIDRKRRYLSFVVVGGGFSGVEMAGELNELVRSSLDFYHHIKIEDISVTLVHSHDQILPEISSSLREFARRKMQRAGVRVLLNRRAALCTGKGVGLQDGEFLPAATVVCTIGTRSLAMIEQLDVPKQHGRLVTEPDMSVPGYPNVWAIGDCAATLNAYDGNMSPATGQFAERQGVQVADNVVARLEGKPTRAFSHRSLGSLCSIGGRNAVAEMLGMRMSGYAAWFAWRAVYLFKLPSLAQQIKVGAEWAFDAIFPRTVTFTKTDPTNRVAKAHYAAGDFVFHKNDPACDFYVIESGEVEILKSVEGSPDLEVVAVLGAGDFFGEHALRDQRPHRHYARARVSSEILVFGHSAFTKLSGSLAPMQAAIADAMKRRHAILDQMPDLRLALDAISLNSLVEKVSSDTFTMDMKIMDVISIINAKKLECGWVLDGGKKLVGIVTPTDLLRALELSAALPEERREHLMISDLLLKDPIVVTLNESTGGVLNAMREHGFKRMPVVNNPHDRQLQGVVRIENILDAAMKQFKLAEAAQ